MDGHDGKVLYGKTIGGQGTRVSIPDIRWDVGCGVEGASKNLASEHLWLSKNQDYQPDLKNLLNDNATGTI